MDEQIRPKYEHYRAASKADWPRSQARPKKLVNKLFPDAPEGRGTGRSTALALDYIAEAIRSPNSWVVVKDHAQGRDYEVLNIIRFMVRSLGLLHFRYKIPVGGEYMIRFDIFEEQ